ncbi:MAG: hypothetical protein J7576_23165 [Siphonobacter aquaeclarae]|nr:hypothetical protein [Siphonobacter aquaeclarae]
MTIYPFLLFLLFSFPALAQEAYVPEKFSNTWVNEIARINGKKVEQDGIISLPSSVTADQSRISLVIPADTIFYRMPNGNTYVRAFLINTTEDSVPFDRQDATLSCTTSEVFLDNVWKTMEISPSASCGNSYWTMSLAPAHFLHLHKEFWYLPGSIPVRYRIRLKNKALDLVSNEIQVLITPKQAQIARGD